MKQENNQYSKIYVDIKNYMVKVGLTIKHESSDSHRQYLCTEIKIGGDYTIRLSAGHNLQEKIVFIQSDFGYSVPAEKRQKVGKLIDLINKNIDTNHFFINSHTGTLGSWQGGHLLGLERCQLILKSSIFMLRKYSETVECFFR